MIPDEYIDTFLAGIRKALPPDHPLQEHELFPGIKLARRPIFIVDDNTAGERIRMDFEQGTRWRKTRFKVPAMQVFKDTAEVAAMIERDHLAELAELAAWRAAAAEEGAVVKKSSRAGRDARRERANDERDHVDRRGMSE